MKLLASLCLFIALAQVEGYRSPRATKTVQRNSLPILSRRITNGEIATRGQFPYQVALIIDFNIFCGASLVAKNTIVTAAICVDGFFNFQAHLGAQTLSEFNEVDRVVIDTTDSLVHEWFNPATIEYDIALIFINEDYTANDQFIKEIRLPSKSSNDLYDGKMATVSGWGSTSDAAPDISNDLRFVEVPVITNTECNEVFGDIPDNNLCTATPDGKSSCIGDSGGPLVNFDSNGVPTLIGIVSFGSSAGCELGYPDGYTRISSFLSWIELNSDVEILP